MLEKAILIFVWVVSIFSFWRFIPQDRRREAQVAFLFMQVVTWPIGLLVVEYGLLDYPIREFYHSTEGSFTFEFLVYPMICAFFNVYYPIEKARLEKFGYYFLWVSIPTGIELLLERYTNLIVYNDWSWYWSWLSLFITLYLSRQYYRWFFKLKN